jgi:TolB-like protein
MQRLNLKKLLAELKRRNVIQAAISYAVFSWVLIQVASILYPSFGWGQDAISKTLIVLIIGFPVWIVFAYVFEWTPSGFKKTENVAQATSISRSTSKKMTGVIIAGMALAIMLLVADRLFNFTETTESTSIDKSIAVLAFADMSPEKDQEYFSDGISEEILNLLAKIPGLKVISRTSSFSYKGKEQNIKKIGEELQVSHVLEGSIRKSGNTFRITTQLINVADGTPSWSETYDRNMEDIFKTQDEISLKVAQQLRVAILGDLAVTKGTNIEAYNLYLLANQVGNQRTYEKNEKN